MDVAVESVVSQTEMRPMMGPPSWEIRYVNQTPSGFEPLGFYMKAESEAPGSPSSTLAPLSEL